MRIRVLAFARFREIMGPEREVELEGPATVGGLLETLCSRLPRLREEICDPAGGVRDHVLVMLNRRQVRLPEGLQAGLAEGDEVAVFPPVAGG
ncbi:MAG: MoaD/ThiS family protein [Methanosarcinales archaeon]|nr:MoaD/ThiS family protein [Methanosarcinales archaeon]